MSKRQILEKRTFFVKLKDWLLKLSLKEKISGFRKFVIESSWKTRLIAIVVVLGLLFAGRLINSKMKEGIIGEKEAYEDYFNFDNLEAEREKIKKYLEKL